MNAWETSQAPVGELKKIACVKYLAGSWYIISIQIGICYSDNHHNTRRGWKRNKHSDDKDDDIDDYLDWLWIPVIWTVILELLLTNHKTSALLQPPLHFCQTRLRSPWELNDRYLAPSKCSRSVGLAWRMQRPTLCSLERVYLFVDPDGSQAILLLVRLPSRTMPSIKSCVQRKVG